MSLSDHIKKIREDIRGGRFTSEAAVSQGILLPTLHELGWPVFDTTIVIPEYSLEGRRVDYALCHPANRPHVFVEVKKIGKSDGADRQLFEYAFHAGVPMAILTDGQEWSFYLPGEQGRYDERRVYKLDLLARDIEEAAKRLKRYADHGRVCSGAALKAARSDYENMARIRTVESFIPKAWKALLRDQDSLLLDLLAEKVEDLCGYKPDPDLCGRFIENQARQPAGIPVQTDKTTPPVSERLKKTHVAKTGALCLEFKGETIPVRSASELMTEFFRILYREDSAAFDRFAARKHGRKRRYLAKDKTELYPGRPDLADKCSVEVVPGWWLGTNYSRRNIQDIINLALEVSEPGFRDAVSADVTKG